MDRIAQWLQDYRDTLIVATVILAVLVVLRRFLATLRRLIRRRRPAELHPKLQKYAGLTQEDIEARGRDAARIVATSSTGQVAGYRIVRQIETVFVEGYASPEEAVAALKAAAGSRGANGLINLSQQRAAAGRCTAQGDAVVIQPSQRPAPAAQRPTPRRPNASTPRGTATDKPGNRARRRRDGS